jgi:hypothetical protein
VTPANAEEVSALMIPDWASHPSGPLRARIASYLGEGWEVDAPDEASAVMARPRLWTRPARLFWNPFYLLYFFRKDRRERVRLTVAADDQVVERPIVD